jgi:signal peptidase I
MKEENYEDKEVTVREMEESDNNSKEEERESKKSSKISIIKDFIFYALLFVFCLYVIPTFIIQKTIVDGPSMEDTLQDKDQLMVEKISYHFNNLKRFDIVVFYPYGREEKEYYIKRIIGLPGETVQIKGEDIYINGEILEENYGKDPITKAGMAANPITLADDEYFVMGDNRKVSFDSRYEEVGPVERKDIGGRAILRVWPLNKFGLLE